MRQEVDEENIAICAKYLKRLGPQAKNKPRGSASRPRAAVRWKGRVALRHGTHEADPGDGAKASGNRAWRVFSYGAARFGGIPSGFPLSC